MRGLRIPWLAFAAGLALRPASAGVVDGSVNLALGQINLLNGVPNFADNRGLSNPHGMVLDTSNQRSAAVDTGNNRVLVWNSLSTLSNGQPADAVLGQADFYSVLANQTGDTTTPGQNTLNYPEAIAFDAMGNLWVADSGNRRVLRFSPPFTTGMNANLVLGNTGYGPFSRAFALANNNAVLRTPSGLAFSPAGNLWVTDSDANRVLRFPAPFTANGQGADIVLGQPDYTIGNTYPNQNMSSPAAYTVAGPVGVAVDASGTHVWVCDTSNMRVLRYSVPLSSGMAADLVLGQADFVSNMPNGGGRGPGATTLFAPSSVSVDPSGTVWVADTVNSRVLGYGAPQSSGMAAGFVVGKNDFLTGGGGLVSPSNITQPYGVQADVSGNLWVADTFDSRVLRFDAPIASAGQGATLVLGQVNFVQGSQNLVDDKGLYQPNAVAVDAAHDRVFVADGGNFRILWWNGIASFANGKAADGELGQTDFYSGQANRGQFSAGSNSLQAVAALAVDASGALWVADWTNARALRFSPPFSNGMSADLVLGQASLGPTYASIAARPPAAGVIKSGSTSFPGGGPPGPRGGGGGGGGPPPPGPNAIGNAAGIALDAHGGVWVADSVNHRVVHFSTPLANGMAADMVLGQADFNGASPNEGNPGPVATSLFGPNGVAVDAAGGVWVNDSNNDRVLRFSPPLSSGMPASIVLGHSDFTTGFQPGIAANTLSGNFGIAVDANGAVWVSDTYDERVLRYSAPQSSGMNADLVVGQSDFISAAVLSNLARSLFSPRGLAVDPSGNLWVADSMNNRVAKFDAGATAGATVVPSTPTTVCPLAPLFNYCVTIPPGGFSHNVTLNMTIPNLIPPVTQPGLLGQTRIAVDVTDDLGLQPAKPITITIPYSTSSVAGLDPTHLVIAYYDTGSQTWVPIPSVVDTTNQVVTGTVQHFTTFSLFQSQAASRLSGVYLYPNPYKPGASGPYGDTTFGRGVVFAGLTPNARIRVLTLSGEVARDVTVSNGTGKYLWNLKNDDGNEVASGVYIYLVSNPDDGSQRATGRFAVIK